jgi:GTP-binding protein HflX
MTRLGAGIGTVGPGETMLETDRRHIRRKIDRLKRDIKVLKKQRETQRKKRIRENIPVAALVGYTNSGKTTLFNAMTESDFLVKDKLFATLDTYMRRIDLGDRSQAVLSDTVGFIRRLPHDLVDAFRSTLEETTKADIIIAVLDASYIDINRHMEVINSVLNDLEITGKPFVIVFNKIDKVVDAAELNRLRNNFSEAIMISALKRINLDKLTNRIKLILNSGKEKIEYVVPQTRMDVVSTMYKYGRVIERRYDAKDDKIHLAVEMDKDLHDKFNKYRK